MPIMLLAFLTLAAPAEKVVTLDPADEEDRLNRVAYFDSLVKLGALRPCQDRFPSQAKNFKQAHDDWTQLNRSRISAGAASIFAAAPEAASEPFDVAGAQVAITQLLSELTEAERLPWCQGHFPLRQAK